ncbi:MAG: hypothetical protein ACOCQE_01265 [Halanaerobium sp.]
MRNIKCIISLLLLLILSFTFMVSADKITLQNGDSYRGELLNDNLKIKTSYAEVNIQSSYLNQIIKEENEVFLIKAVENNRFSGDLLSDLRFSSDGEELVINKEDLKLLDLSSPQSFNDNKAVSVTVKNGDYFYANSMVDSISVQTSLGSPINIKFSSINSIEYLKNEELYLIKRKQGDDIKAEFAQNKLVVWPAAGEIFELDLNHLQRLELNN